MTPAPGQPEESDRLTVITRLRLVSSTVMRRSIRITLTVTLAAVALALTGGTIGLIVAEVDQPAAATVDPHAVECANITRAYNSWAAGSRDMYDFESITEPDMQTQLDDQRELLEAAQGYPGQPSKDLALAVATLGAELATLNAELTIDGRPGVDQAAATATAHGKVRQAYASWKATTCG